jgi:hypothetical protein
LRGAEAATLSEVEEVAGGDEAISIVENNCTLGIASPPLRCAQGFGSQ